MGLSTVLVSRSFLNSSLLLQEIISIKSYPDAVLF